MPPPTREFEALYRDHYDFVWRNAQRLGVPAASLDDVLQEVFIVAYRRLPDYDGRAAPSTWLFGILHNVWRNHRRGSARSDRKHAALGQQSAIWFGQRRANSQRAAELELAGRLLAEFLAELDDHQRTVFVLAELEGMTGPEIAAALELNLNTARSRLRAARRAFESRFEAHTEIDALTDSLRRDPPRATTEQRDRTHALVLAGIGSLPRVAGTGALGLGAAKLIGGVALVVCAVSGVGFLLAENGSGELIDEPTRTAVVEPRERAETLSPTVEATDAPIPVQAQPVPTRAAVVEPTSPSLTHDADAARLAAARAALLDGSPHLALEQLADIALDGPLGWERTVTEVAARCALDQLDAAREAAARWNRLATGTPIEVPCEDRRDIKPAASDP
jgi:RNA polymerase sigma factor (sigma-70 family)